MLRRPGKTATALLLVLSLLLLPMSTVYAQEKESTASASDYQNNTEAAGNQEEALTLAGLQTSADAKANLLTSVYGVTSVQYALIDDGKIAAAGQAGMADKKTKAKPAQDTIYGIGSISKMFTAAAVMQLVEQGRVELDAPVTRYIPEFKMADARYKDITVRMLLNHSSGLMGSSLSNSMLFDCSEALPVQDLLSQLKNSVLKADPGAYSVYCNDGFSLAELLVEKVSGLSFTGYLSKNITGPLGLTHTKTPMDTFDRKRMAKTYRNGMEEPLPADVVTATGAGGIYSTAEDLCRFAQIFMGDQNKVLAASSAKAMSETEYLKGIWPEEEAGMMSFGLGWDCVNAFPFQDYGLKALTKGGDTLVYHGSLVVLPEKGIALAVLSSGGSSGLNQVFAQSVILEELKAKNEINEIKPAKVLEKPVNTTIPDSMLKYEGVYANVSSAMKVQMDKSGVLILGDPSGATSLTQQLSYSKDGKFYTQDGSTYLSFKEESNGNTYIYLFGYTNLPGLGQAVTSGYQYQKLENNPVSKELKAAWEKRNNKAYFIINENYNSQLYVLSSLISRFPFLKEPEGYYFNAAIMNKDSARMELQIPGNSGRDLHVLTFFRKGTVEYLQCSGYIMIPEDAIKAISAKAKFTCKIGSEGYAEWYKTGKAAGKKMKVVLPKKASFSVYDANMTCIFNSLISGKDTAVLPEDGYIVFAGAPKASFTITYVK